MERKLSKSQIRARKWKRDMATQLSLRKSHEPIPGKELRQRWGKSKSYIVKVISDLILGGGEKIGSCPLGYFPILDERDLQVAIDFLRDRGFRLLLRCAILSRRHVESIFMDSWRENWEKYADTESMDVKRSVNWTKHLRGLNHAGRRDQKVS